MDRDIVNIFKNLIDIQYKLLENVKNKTNEIISCKNRDISIIEYYLDVLLNMDLIEAEDVFNKLCSYYETVDYDNAMEYFKIYDEFNNRKDISLVKKRTKENSF